MKRSTHPASTMKALASPALVMGLTVFLCGGVNAQTFLNGDLEGPNPTGGGQLPPEWEAVPWTDPNCLSSGPLEDTPDLTSATSPYATAGVPGNPYSGSTFISSVWGTSGSPNWVFQEGIMQTVEGFSTGVAYTIGFHQAVVKQNGYLDTAGSWIVYVDTVLVGITEPTISFAPVDGVPFIWEPRALTFTATAAAHTIKFLPWDDDPDNLFPPADTMGALRMGIDAITLSVASSIPEQGVAMGQLRAFPDPASDVIFVEASADIHPNSAIIMTDAMGREVLRTKLEGGRVRIDVDRIPAGTYMLRTVGGACTRIHRIR